MRAGIEGTCDTEGPAEVKRGKMPQARIRRAHHIGQKRLTKLCLRGVVCVAKTARSTAPGGIEIDVRNVRPTRLWRVGAFMPSPRIRMPDDGRGRWRRRADVNRKLTGNRSARSAGCQEEN